jgi:hypothetical protein
MHYIYTIKQKDNSILKYFVKEIDSGFIFWRNHYSMEFDKEKDKMQLNKIKNCILEKKATLIKTNMTLNDFIM